MSSNSESFIKPASEIPMRPVVYSESLELVLSAIPHKPNRDYLRQAVQTMLAHGFTHITGEGWKPTDDTLMVNPSRAGEVEAAIKTLSDMGYTYHGGSAWKPPLGKPPLCIDVRYAMAVAVLELDGFTWDADHVNWRKSITPGIGEDHSLRAREHLMPHGVAAIMSERIRQIHVESYTVADDLDYDKDELVGAALAYVSAHWYGNSTAGRPPQPWPWDAKFWKPVDRRRDLERAGALIAAELDRMAAAERGGA